MPGWSDREGARPQLTVAAETRTRRPSAAADGGIEPERTRTRGGAACGDAPNYWKNRESELLVQLFI